MCVGGKRGGGGIRRIPRIPDKTNGRRNVPCANYGEKDLQKTCLDWKPLNFPSTQYKLQTGLFFLPPFQKSFKRA